MASSSHASARACERCTRSKRKCDKALPICGRCHRLSFICVYDAPDNSVSSSSPAVSGSSGIFEALASARVDAAGTRSRQSDTPLRQQFGLDWLETSEKYFRTVHHWFRILHPEKFHRIMRVGYENYALQGQRHDRHPNPELASRLYDLLVLCMYLLTKTVHLSDSESSIFCSVYEKAKETFALIASFSVPCRELIQCGAMLSLFEFGHGRLMAAYQTLSQTATMVHVSGIEMGKYVEGLEALPPDEDEVETRALCWGVFILDQYVHLSPISERWPSLMKVPEDDDLLPSTGVLWDGTSFETVTVRLPVNAPFPIPLGGFQRAAQSAVLLYKARHLKVSLESQQEFPVLDNLTELDARIHSLLDVMLHQGQGWEAFCDGFAMSIASLFLVHRSFLPPYSPRLSQLPFGSSIDTERSLAAVAFGIRFITDLAINFNSHLEHHPEWLSNLAPPATAACWMAYEQIQNPLLAGNAEKMEKGAEEIIKALKTFNKRWKVAEDMLRRVGQPST